MKSYIKSLWSSFSFKTKLIVGTVSLLLLVGTVWSVTSKIKQYYFDRKIASLEETINQANNRSQELENQVNSVSSIISGIRTQLEETKAENARLNEVVKNAKVRYIEIRNPNRPVFVSTTPDGKVTELNSVLDQLYPDSPNRR